MRRRWEASYWPALDGLRGFAAALVTLFHTQLAVMKGGFIGVDIFFILSGFLVTRILLGELTDTGSISFWRFIRRRVIRLLPALLVLLAVCLAWALILRNQPRTGETLDTIPLAALNLSNWAFAADGHIPMGLLAHTWSLGIEWQFYLLIPLVLLVLSRTGVKPVNIAVFTAAVIIGTAAWRAALWSPTVDGQFRVYAGFDTRVDGPLLGALVAVGLNMGFAPRTPTQRRAVEAAGFTAFATLMACAVLIDGLTPFLYRRGGMLLVGLAAATLIFSLVTSPPPVARKLFRWRPLVGLGKISYGLYLWHFPVVVLVNQSRLGELPKGPIVLIDCLASLLLALLSYKYVERPVLTFINHRRTRPAEPAGAVRPVESLAEIVPMPQRPARESERYDHRATSEIGSTSA